MTPYTTKIGLTVLDRAFGGIYLHRPTLICGRKKSGKSVIATHLATKTLLSGENMIIFTDKSPEEFLLNADATKMDLSQALASGQLLLLPYDTMTRDGSGKYAPLPFPEALDELRSLVKAHHVSYVIFDTIVPWMATLPVEEMPDHVDRTITAFNEMGLTSLILLPEPASAASRKLTEVLRELCPINMEIESRNFGAEFALRVTKYQGGNRAKLPLEFTLNLIPGVGFEQVTANDIVTLKSGTDEELTATRISAKTRTYKPFISQGLTDFSEGQPSPSAVRSSNPPAASQQVQVKQAVRSVYSVEQPKVKQTIRSVYNVEQTSRQASAPQAQNDDTKSSSAPKPSFAKMMDYEPIKKASSPAMPSVGNNDSNATWRKPSSDSGGIKFSSIIR